MTEWEKLGKVDKYIMIFDMTVPTQIRAKSYFRAYNNKTEGRQKQI